MQVENIEAPSGPRSRRRSSGQTARTTGPALEAMYQFLLWLIPTLEKFPRSQKFLLGDRLQTQALAVLDHLIAATYSRERGGHLRAANLELEKLRFGLRLVKDLEHIDFNRYEFAARALDEVGRMVGGWLKIQGTAHAPNAPEETIDEGRFDATPA